MDTLGGTSLSEDSPSVQAHLSILQAIVLRMATNSSACKAWCISIVSAILVLVADKGKPQHALIALLPTLLFLALDAYYLSLEKHFRAAYNGFVAKVHSGVVRPADLFSIEPGVTAGETFAALRSFSVWAFYLPLVLLVELVRRYILP